MGFLNLITPQKKNVEPIPAQQSGPSKKYLLDTLGEVCPFPLVEAKRAIAPLNSGDELQIDFDCTQATDSIPAWAAQNGHTVTDFRQVDAASWTVTVKKA